MSSAIAWPSAFRERAMELNKLVFGALALGCLGAAAAGGYLAARQGSVPATEVVASSPAPTGAPTDVVSGSAGKAVAESEGVIAPDTPAAPPAEAPKVAPPQAEPTPRARRVEPAPSRRGATAPTSRRAGSQSASTPAAAPAPAVTQASSSGGTMWEVRPAIEPERAPASSEPEAPLAPAEPEVIDLVVPADSVLGLQIERTVSSETARVEDRVEARVTRDVRVGDRVAIPAGSVVQGSVMEVERGGKVKERARLGIRFHTVVLADGSRLNIRTDSVVREGASPANESAAKIGGAAVGGAILGAILGGGKGAIIGGSVGAAGGTAATMAGGRNAAVLPAGTTVSVRVQQPVTVSVSKE